jgi:class 3 adenylate cyclase/TolB-like protein/tetratricopeptide (TPR) repeat protein
MPDSPEHSQPLRRSSNVIAVADVVESVRLMEQDEQAFIRRWQRFVGFVQQRLPHDSGRLHKSLGDGLMLEFSDPHGCIRAVLAMREWFGAANEDLPPEDHVQLRIGAHVADFVSDQYDIYGTDVNLAARLASLAGPGEIVISAALREQLAPPLHAGMEDLGTCHLKHVRKPVHAFRVGEAGSAPVMPVRRPAAHSLRPTVAVLPFGLQGEGGRGLTGEALADDIVAELTRGDQLQVVSRLSTTQLGAARASLEEIRRAVGAHYVLNGRARRQPAELSLLVELADTATGEVVWAHQFVTLLRDSAPADVRWLREAVGSLHAAVIEHAVERSRGQPLPSQHGHALLLSSIGLMHRMDPAEMERSRGMLEHLVERAPCQGAPQAWLAHLHLLRLRERGAAVLVAEAAAARRHAAAAMRCDCGAPLALAIEGEALLYAAHDIEAAQERCAQALRSRPNDSLALLLKCELLALQGSGLLARQAAARASEAVAMRPLLFLHDSGCALAALVAGDTEAAIAWAQRALERSPNYLPALRTLVAAQVLGGSLPRARATAQRLMARHAGCSVPGLLASLPASAAVSQLFERALQQTGLPAA